MRRIGIRILGLIWIFLGVLSLVVQAAPPETSRPPVASPPRPRMVVQLGHAGDVHAVAYSADGRLVLTGSDDQTAKLWDTTTGKEFRRFAGHKGIVTAVAFSADARSVATGADDSTARLWDTSTASEIRQFAHPGPVTSLVLFSQRSQLATGCTDGSARLWNIATGECTATFSGHTQAVRSVAVSADGKQLLTGSDDQTAALWNVSDRKLIARLAEHKAPIYSVAISPDGQTLLTGSLDLTARTWQSPSGRPLHVLPVTKRVFSVAFSPDGRQIVTGNEGFPIRGEEPAEMRHTVRLWNVETGKQVRSLRDFGSSARAVAFAPDGKQVLVGATGNASFFGPRDGVSHLWNIETGEPVRTFKAQGVAMIESLAFSPDGRWLLMGGDDGIARLWDGETGREMQRFKHPSGRILALAFSRDSRIVVTGGDDSAVRIWDRELGTEIRRIEGHANGVVSVAISPDLRWVLSGSADSSARLWDASTGRERFRLAEYTGQTESMVPFSSYVAFSPDGSQFATAQWDNTAHLWNTADGREVRSFEGHENRVVSVAFTSDGKRVVTASWDGTTRVWDVASGRQLLELRGHDTWVRAVAISPDDKRVLTASKDGTARLWNLEDGKELHCFLGHHATGQSVAFAASGLVAASNRDSSATIFGAEAREICTLVNCDAGNLIVTPEGNYMATKGALKTVAFGIGNRGLPFDQFDLKFNRPDLVLAAIGLAPRELTDAYRELYQKRLRKLNLQENMLGDDFHLPEVTVLSDRVFATEDKRLRLTVRAQDSTRRLERLLVEVNGVPLEGAAGIPLGSKNVKTWEQEVEIELSGGKNTIEISALNDEGAESLKEVGEVRCDAPAVVPDLYVVAVGVSDYVDARFRLTYAHKDAADLAAYCQSQSKRFGKVHVHLLQNRDATREKILPAKKLLEQSRVDDEVVLFFAGHGLLDARRDYYFATADIDFAQPAKSGLSYEDVEGLVAGIRARKKLLLIDTCHSGEADKDDLGLVAAEVLPQGTVRARAFRDFQVLGETVVAPRQSRPMLEEMFADLRRGTGAVIISAAGSAEYALESADWQNGVFTYAVLAGMKHHKADANSDGQLWVSELRDYVQQEVRRMTRGRQSPIARKENIEIDFRLN